MKKEISVTQAAHGFKEGDPLHLDGKTWVKSTRMDSVEAIVTEAEKINSFTLALPVNRPWSIDEIKERNSYVAFIEWALEGYYTPYGKLDSKTIWRTRGPAGTIVEEFNTYELYDKWKTTTA
jgi:hypothetical protein